MESNEITDGSSRGHINPTRKLSHPALQTTESGDSFFSATQGQFLMNRPPATDEKKKKKSTVANSEYEKGCAEITAIRRIA